MITRWIAIASSITTSAAVAAAPLPDQNRVVQVETADRQFNRALERSDVDELRKLIAETYVFTDPTGRVSHKQELMQGFASGRIRIKSQKTQDLQVQAYGDVAVETGLLTSVAVRDGQNTSGNFRFTRVWANIGGRWQTVAFQETAPKELPRVNP